MMKFKIVIVNESELLMANLNGVWSISEEIEKEISQKSMPGAFWHTALKKIVVYSANNTNASELINAKLKTNPKSIRLAVDDDGNLFFWNGQVFHDGVANATGKFWILKFVWINGKDYVEVVSPGVTSIKMFKKYVETDGDFIKGIKQLKKLLKVKKLKFDSEFIDI